MVRKHMQRYSKTRNNIQEGIDNCLCSDVYHRISFDPSRIPVYTMSARIGKVVIIESGRLAGNRGPIISKCTLWNLSDGVSKYRISDFVWWLTFDCWHDRQTLTQERIWWSISGQKYLVLTNFKVPEIPGCDMFCRSSITLSRQSTGTNRHGYGVHVPQNRIVSLSRGYGMRRSFNESKSGLPDWALAIDGKSKQSTQMESMDLERQSATTLSAPRIYIS